MLISSAAELLGEAERLAAEGGEEPAGKENGGEEPAGKENGGEAPAAAAANGEAAPPSGLEHVEAEAAAEEEEELTPAQTAQHFAMRNLMNAGGWWHKPPAPQGSERNPLGQERMGVCAWPGLQGAPASRLRLTEPYPCVGTLTPHPPTGLPLQPAYWMGCSSTSGPRGCWAGRWTLRWQPGGRGPCSSST